MQSVVSIKYVSHSHPYKVRILFHYQAWWHMATIPATQPGQPAQEGQGVEREEKKDRKPNILRMCLQ